MEKGRLTGDQLKFSDSDFLLLLTFLSFLDGQRRTTAISEVTDPDIVDFYKMLDGFYYDNPAVRLSIAGMALGAVTEMESRDSIVSILERGGLLQSEAINEASNLSQKINFLRSFYDEFDSRFTRLLDKNYEQIVADPTDSQALNLTKLSMLWSASHSDKFRHDVEKTIGQQFSG